LSGLLWCGGRKCGFSAIPYGVKCSGADSPPPFCWATAQEPMRRGAKCEVMDQKRRLGASSAAGAPACPHSAVVFMGWVSRLIEWVALAWWSQVCFSAIPYGVKCPGADSPPPICWTTAPEPMRRGRKCDVMNQRSRSGASSAAGAPACPHSAVVFMGWV